MSLYPDLTFQLLGGGHRPKQLDRVIRIPRRMYAELLQVMRPEERILTVRPDSKSQTDRQAILLISPTPEGQRRLYFVPDDTV